MLQARELVYKVLIYFKHDIDAIYISLSLSVPWI
jgi:hypothetical protein